MRALGERCHTITFVTNISVEHQRHISSLNSVLSGLSAINKGISGATGDAESTVAPLLLAYEGVSEMESLYMFMTLVDASFIVDKAGVGNYNNSVAQAYASYSILQATAPVWRPTEAVMAEIRDRLGELAGALSEDAAHIIKDFSHIATYSSFSNLAYWRLREVMSGLDSCEPIGFLPYVLIYGVPLAWHGCGGALVTLPMALSHGFHALIQQAVESGLAESSLPDMVGGMLATVVMAIRRDDGSPAEFDHLERTLRYYASIAGLSATSKLSLFEMQKSIFYEARS